GSIIFRCGTLGLDSFISIWVLHFCWSRVQLKVPRFCVRASLDTNVSDMSVNDPKCLFPPEPEHYGGPKLKVAIIGAGLAGMSTAVELLDQGHEVDIYESRSFIGGKVGSFIDKHGNHIEMGLHIFFGCYNNLFRLMKKTYDKARNALALALSPVVRALIDPDGALKDVGDLDSISFSDWFLSKGGTRTSIQRMWDPVAYALGFIDCDNISAHCMLAIFALFATKTEASLLRMLKGSPDVYLSGPIRKHITDKGGRFHLRWGCREILYDKSANGETYVKGLAMSKATDKKVVQAEAYVTACDVPGIKRSLPSSWREMKFFNNIYELVGVPAVTVQLRYNGWVTELQDLERSRQLRQALGLDDLLYTPHADFSCFADLALTSPEDYYREGQGSLLQCVLTPGDPYMPLPNDEIIRRVAKQVAPKGLFLPEPEHYRGPKLKVAIIGAGLAGMSTAVDLLDQGHGTEASLLLMLKGSPDVYLSGPIRKYITDKGGRYATDKKVVQLQVHG
ncbi:hypothetical protein CUMW_083870, partial [Citrus unshiu]